MCRIVTGNTHVKFEAHSFNHFGVMLAYDVRKFRGHVTVTTVSVWKTSNLSKAHVTRDSSGPAIWAILYSMQWNINAFWKSTRIWRFHMEDSLSLRSRNLNC